MRGISPPGVGDRAAQRRKSDYPNSNRHELVIVVVLVAFGGQINLALAVRAQGSSCISALSIPFLDSPQGGRLPSTSMGDISPRIHVMSPRFGIHYLKSQPKIGHYFRKRNARAAYYSAPQWRRRWVALGLHRGQCPPRSPTSVDLKHRLHPSFVPCCRSRHQD